MMERRLIRALSETDERTLIRAYGYLEHPGFAIRLSHLLGSPIEKTLKLMPKPWSEELNRQVETTIGEALEFAITHWVEKVQHGASEKSARRWGTLSGALGGFLGGPALLLELPVTTTLILGSIADIARCEGEALESLETRLACLEVFALGGRSDRDDAAETGYYGLRLALEVPVANAARHLAESSITHSGKAPALIGLINAITKRYGVVLSQKSLAELVPIIGGVGGALINRLFIQHFQDMARSHFSVRRLERSYGRETVQAAYARIGVQGDHSPVRGWIDHQLKMKR